MLNEIRAHAGNLGAKLLLAFLVLTFGIWGIGDMLRHTSNNANVATVGTKNISLEEYQHALRRETENARRELGDRYTPEMLKQLNLPQHVVHDLIQQTLLGLEVSALQLIPSDTDVVLRIRSNTSFQDNKGNFDKGIFESVLRNSNLTEKAYVEKLRQDMATSLILDTLSASVPLPQIAVETLYQARQEQRTATLYTLSASLAPTPSKADDGQVAAYYHEHERDFNAPEYRTVSYVSFTNADIQAKTTVSEADIKNAYQERIDEFKTPERRTVEQLIYDSEDKAKKAVTELRSGTSLEQVAKTTPVLNKNAIEMGKVERSHVIEAAEEAVFSLPKDGITDPIQSPFGWHVFHVTAIEAPRTQTYEEARPTLEKDQKQKVGEDALNKMANSLEDAIAGGSTLQEAAKEFGLTVKSVGPFDHSGKTSDGKATAGLPDFDKFLDTAFKTEEKSESSLVGSKGGVNYLLSVDAVTPVRLRTLDEVKGLATAGWQREEHDKRMQELAAGIAKKFANPGERDGIIAADKLKASGFGPVKRNDQKSGVPQGLLGDVFTHQSKESTAAYPVGNGDYVIAVVGTVIPAPKSSDVKDDRTMADIREEMGNVSRREILEEYMRYLAGKYPVTVNQSLLQPPDND